MMKKIILGISTITLLNSCTKDIKDIFNTDKIKITQDIEFKNSTALYKFDDIKADYIVFNRSSFLNSDAIGTRTINPEDLTTSATDTPYLFTGSTLKFQKDIKYPNAFYGITREIKKDYTVDYFDEFGKIQNIKLEKGKKIFYVFTKIADKEHYLFRSLISENVISEVNYTESLSVLHFVYNTTTNAIKEGDNFTFNYEQYTGGDKSYVLPIHGTKAYLPVFYSYKLVENDYSRPLKIDFNFKAKDKNLDALNLQFEKIYNEGGNSLYYDLHKDFIKK